jgi:SAM-dependent methyltransferase
MSHDHASHDPVSFTPEFWDARYSSADALWSGEPNLRLVEQIAGVSPGTALDVGCGEGADAIWLAARGWQVTGLDVSVVALDRAAQRASATDAEAASRITWQQADLLSWDPGPLQFDLVSAQFMQLPKALREPVHRRLAAAVRPGGRLLIVSHHPSDLETTVRRPQAADLFATAEEIAASLDLRDWDILVVSAPERQALDPDGHHVTIHDTVLHAQRIESA